MRIAIASGDQPVFAEGVIIDAPGVEGTAEVGDPTPDAFSEALAANDVTERKAVTLDLKPPPSVGRGRSAPGPSLTFTEVPPDERKVLLVKDGDTYRWVLPNQPPPGARALATPDVTFTLPPPPPSDTGGADGTRGISGALAKRVIKALTFPLIGKVAGVGANRFATHWENKHRPHLLREFTPDTYRDRPVGALPAEMLRGYGDDTVLLFVHGTASTSYTGFGGIPQDLMKELHQRYDGRVIAFDHPTISKSPTDNARELGKILKGTRLNVDIVSHSRGGLVSRLFAEQPQLAGGALTVRRLVMVGTPNAGTALAHDDHMLSYLDRLTTMLDIVPDNPVTDALSVIVSVVKQVAAGAFGGLPGLNAMTPGGKWLTALNDAQYKTDAEYFAVASDFEPAKNSKFAVFARDEVTDRIFQGEGNDLVVPTSGVYADNGGGKFPIAKPAKFKASDSIDHSNYWATDQFRSKLLQWLC